MFMLEREYHSLLVKKNDNKMPQSISKITTILKEKPKIDISGPIKGMSVSLQRNDLEILFLKR